jgi:hypothetical protein
MVAEDEAAEGDLRRRCVVCDAKLVTGRKYCYRHRTGFVKKMQPKPKGAVGYLFGMMIMVMIVAAILKVMWENMMFIIIIIAIIGLCVYLWRKFL